jgi:TetR/AcrR family transcriptional regulator
MSRRPTPRRPVPSASADGTIVADPAGSARERIVAAATREFAERGHAGARIDAIGRAAGVNKALLYYYFPSKQELYRALVLDHLAAAGRRLAAEESATRPAGATLARTIEAFVDLHEARPFAPLLLVRELLNAWGHLHDEDFAVLLTLARPVTETVRRGVEAGELRAVPPLFVHMMLMGAMNLFLVSAPARARGSRLVGQPDIDPDPRAFARFVAEIVERGLAIEPPAPSTPSPGAAA